MEVHMWKPNKTLLFSWFQNAEKGFLQFSRHPRPQFALPWFLGLISAPIPTGSAEEREAFRKANHLNKLVEKEETGMAMRIRVAESMSLGNDFDVFAHISNNTAEEHTCSLLLCARTVSYNGVLGPECGTEHISDLSLEPYSGMACLA